MNNAPSYDVPIKYHRLWGADKIEDILCLTVLISAKILLPTATIKDAIYYWEDINGCENCLANQTCLACIINE
jgi:hypothetical protein